MPDKKKILIVDDNKEIAELTQTVLKKRGFDTQLLYQGLEVIPFLEENHVDILLLDNILPDATGRDLCAQIKANPAYNHCTIILASGFLNTSSCDIKEEKYSPDKELLKPYDIDDLIKMIEEI